MRDFLASAMKINSISFLISLHQPTLASKKKHQREKNEKNIEKMLTKAIMPEQTRKLKSFTLSSLLLDEWTRKQNFLKAKAKFFLQHGNFSFFPWKRKTLFDTQRNNTTSRKCTWSSRGESRVGRKKSQREWWKSDFNLRLIFLPFSIFMLISIVVSAIFYPPWYSFFPSFPFEMLD